MSDDVELLERDSASANEVASADLSGRQVLMKGTALKEVRPSSALSHTHPLPLHCTVRRATFSAFLSAMATK